MELYYYRVINCSLVKIVRCHISHSFSRVISGRIKSFKFSCAIIIFSSNKQLIYTGLTFYTVFLILICNRFEMTVTCPGVDSNNLSNFGMYFVIDRFPFTCTYTWHIPIFTFATLEEFILIRSSRFIKLIAIKSLIPVKEIKFFSRVQQKNNL